MRIYIACARARVERARTLARALDRTGVHTIVSRWHLGDGAIEWAESAEAARDLYVCDWRDMGNAEALLALTEVDRAVPIGREELVEVGMAAARALPIVWSSERDPKPELACFFGDGAYEARTDSEVVAVFGILQRGGTPRAMKQRALFG